MFRRRRGRDPEDVEGVEEQEIADEEAALAGPDVSAATAPPRPGGPHDVADDYDPDLPRLDLGGLRVPVLDGVQLRVDVDPQSNEVVAATIMVGDSAIQLNAFAAPKSSGIWAEVRAEIIEGVRDGGGAVEEADGPFGVELRGRVPTEVPERGIVQAPARFLGVDGPRWFLRGLINGPAATDPAQAEVIEATFRDVVVVRGGDAMAPRDALPLHLPREAMEAQAAGDPAAGEQAPSLDPFDRGPEITEIR